MLDAQQKKIDWLEGKDKNNKTKFAIDTEVLNTTNLL